MNHHVPGLEGQGSLWQHSIRDVHTSMRDLTKLPGVAGPNYEPAWRNTGFIMIHGPILLYRLLLGSLFLLSFQTQALV